MAIYRAEEDYEGEYFIESLEDDEERFEEGVSNVDDDEFAEPSNVVFI